MGDQAMKLEENKRKLEEANKKKMEEMKAQQQELIAKRAAEQKKKEDELAAKKLEQVAVLQVRRVLQQFRAANPDNYEKNKTELDEAMEKHGEALGSQKERL